MMFDAAKTAIGRKGPSVPARRFAKHLQEMNIDLCASSVLDWGCGRGVDSNWFAELGLYAIGYDPTYRPWDPSKFSHMQHDFITCFYVLNVIPTKKGRADVIHSAASYLRGGGKMFIAVRAKRSIDYIGKNWTKHRDGYKTSKNTFQHGHSKLCLPSRFCSSNKQLRQS